jgi:orotidine-5'-phosphate decarboxylase
LEKCQHKPLLIAVTVLTSMEQNDLAGIGLNIEPKTQVERLARLTQQAGLDGVVCSAQEVALIRSLGAPRLLTVTPGIRPEGAEVGDQRRIMTPKQAQQAGVDFMVIGRPITQAVNPAQACAAILASLN